MLKRTSWENKYTDNDLHIWDFEDLILTCMLAYTVYIVDLHSKTEPDIISVLILGTFPNLYIVETDVGE